MARSILLELPVTERASERAKRQEPGVLYKDGCFLGVGPEGSFELVDSLSPGDRLDYVSAKPALRDVFDNYCAIQVRIY